MCANAEVGSVHQGHTTKENDIFSGMVLYASRDYPLSNNKELLGDNFMILKCLGKVSETDKVNNLTASEASEERDSHIFEKMMAEAEAIKAKATKALQGVIDNGYQFHDAIEAA